MSYNRHSCLPKTHFTYNTQPAPVGPFRKTQNIPQQYSVDPVHTPAFPYQSYQTRSASVPIQKAISTALFPNQSLIKIESSLQERSRPRKHKIFDEKWSPQRYSPPRLKDVGSYINSEFKASAEEKSSQKIQAAVQCEIPPSLGEQSPIEHQNVHVPNLTPKRFTESQQKLHKQALETSKIKSKPYYKETERIMEVEQFVNSTFSNSELLKKDRQISYLKQEVQRLKRCGRLNKQNQSLYKRLVDKLKDQSFNTTALNTTKLLISQPQSPNIYKETPAEVVHEIPKEEIFVSQTQKSNTIVNKKGGIEVISKKQSPSKSPPQRKSPLAIKKSPERSASILINELANSNTLTFNEVNQSKRVHPKRLLAYQCACSSKNRRRFAQNFENDYQIAKMPVSKRLAEINRNLERSIAYDRPRSCSKPSWTPNAQYYVDTISARALNSSSLRQRGFMYS